MSDDRIAKIHKYVSTDIEYYGDDDEILQDMAFLLAEIDRLRAEVARTEDMARDANRECIKQMNGVDRLRAHIARVEVLRGTMESLGGGCMFGADEIAERINETLSPVTESEES